MLYSSCSGEEGRTLFAVVDFWFQDRNEHGCGGYGNPRPLSWDMGSGEVAEAAVHTCWVPSMLLVEAILSSPNLGPSAPPHVPRL